MREAEGEGDRLTCVEVGVEDTVRVMMGVFEAVVELDTPNECVAVSGGVSVSEGEACRARGARSPFSVAAPAVCARQARKTRGKGHMTLKKNVNKGL